MRLKIVLLIILSYTAGFTNVWGQSGSVGENIKWSLSDSTLTISGTGYLEILRQTSWPWHDYRNSIKGTSKN